MADCRASLQVQTRKDIENDVTANFDRLVAMVRKAMAHRYGGRIPPASRRITGSWRHTERHLTTWTASQTSLPPTPIS